MKKEFKELEFIQGKLFAKALKLCKGLEMDGDDLIGDWERQKRFLNIRFVNMSERISDYIIRNSIHDNPRIVMTKKNIEVSYLNRTLLSITTLFNEDTVVINHNIFINEKGDEKDEFLIYYSALEI